MRNPWHFHYHQCYNISVLRQGSSSYLFVLLSTLVASQAQRLMVFLEAPVGWVAQAIKDCRLYLHVHLAPHLVG